jgi:hypothetical protein
MGNANASHRQRLRFDAIRFQSRTRGANRSFTLRGIVSASKAATSTSTNSIHSAIGNCHNSDTRHIAPSRASEKKSPTILRNRRVESPVFADVPDLVGSQPAARKNASVTRAASWSGFQEFEATPAPESIRCDAGGRWPRVPSRSAGLWPAPAPTPPHLLPWPM